MDPAAAAASASPTDPRWAMLGWLVDRRDESIVPDAKTVADCHTPSFGGGQLRVSMSLAPPPDSSFLYYDWTGRDEHEQLGPQDLRVMAAHGDSVLLETPRSRDCFVYRAGAATRPPSLSQLLLPAGDRRVCEHNTGLLRRSEEEELLVAQLEVTPPPPPPMSAFDTFMAEVWVLDAGTGTREWELKQPATPIIVDDEDKRDRLRQWCWHDYMGSKVVPVGDRFLCCVDFFRGFVLVCDMADECSRLRYVPLPLVPDQPTDPYSYDYARSPEIEWTRDICGVAVDGDNGGGALKFVSIDLRCCCCARSANAFLVTTWTLELDGAAPMAAWVKGAALDCGSSGRCRATTASGPRVVPEFPVVSLDNPDVVCFVVSEAEFGSWEERKVWTVAVDMGKKALLSVVVSCTHSLVCR